MIRNRYTWGWIAENIVQILPDDELLQSLVWEVRLRSLWAVDSEKPWQLIVPKPGPSKGTR